MRKIKILKAFINSVLKIYCKIAYRIKVEGLENVPKEGAIIFCGNHRAYLDSVLIHIYTPREIRFLSKEELSKNIFLGFFMKIYKAIPVKRDSKDLFAIKESIKTLKTNNCLAIFPEGTRNGFEKNNGEIKSGATYLAIKTGASIVPIGIKGKLKLFSRITITYGKKIDYLEYSKQKITKQIEEKTTKQLKEAIIELTKE